MKIFVDFDPQPQDYKHTREAYFLNQEKFKKKKNLKEIVSSIFLSTYKFIIIKLSNFFRMAGKSKHAAESDTYETYLP